MQWGISKRRVQIYCEEDRIKGAFKYVQYWLIPKDAQKPQEKICLIKFIPNYKYLFLW